MGYVKTATVVSIVVTCLPIFSSMPCNRCRLAICGTVNTSETLKARSLLLARFGLPYQSVPAEGSHAWAWSAWSLQHSCCRVFFFDASDGLAISLLTFENIH